MPTNHGRAMKFLVLVLVASLMTGCSDGKDAVATPASATVSALPASPAAEPPPESSPLPEAPLPAAATPPPAEAWLLNLDGEGLRIFNSNTGASRLIAFGEDSTQSLDTISRVLGEPVPIQVENEECQVSFARWSNGLTAWSDGKHFVGWSVAAQAPTLGTTAGVKLGTSRADLQGAYQAEIFESSLGTEFSAGGLAGLLDSARADARITNLWAGQTCIAR